MAAKYSEVPQNDVDKALGTRIVKNYDRLVSERSVWDQHWDQIAKYIIPKKDNVYGGMLPGEEKDSFLFDNTSVHANELLASALHSLLTNPSSVWLGFSSNDDATDQLDVVQKAYQDRVDLILFYLNNSNFQTEVHEFYLDIGSFGTSVFLVEEDVKRLLRFKACPIYRFAVDEDAHGMVDTVYYCYELDARQMVKEFGEDVCFKCREIKDEYHKMQGGNSSKKFEVIRAVEPREDAGDGIFPKSMPVRSTYILKRNKYVLKDSGFKELPYIVSRWSKISGEKFGRSPGMKALADIRMLNSMMKVTLSAAQLSIAPPWQAPDDGILMPIKTYPHAVNHYRSGSKDRIEPLITGARPDIGLDMIDKVRLQIRQAFFIDQLQLQEGPQMTATEVMQRTEEKLRLMAPVIGRLHYEFLDPLITRVYNILDRKGVFPPLPDQLQGKELTIKFVSQIAKAQRATEADSFVRLLQVAAPILEMDPDARDLLDADAIVRRLANIYSVHNSFIKDVVDVKKLRQAKAQAMEKERSMQQNLTNADTANKMASANQMMRG